MCVCVDMAVLWCDHTGDYSFYFPFSLKKFISFKVKICNLIIVPKIFLPNEGFAGPALRTKVDIKQSGRRRLLSGQYQSSSLPLFKSCRISITVLASFSSWHLIFFQKGVCYSISCFVPPTVWERLEVNLKKMWSHCLNTSGLFTWFYNLWVSVGEELKCENKQWTN